MDSILNDGVEAFKDRLRSHFVVAFSLAWLVFNYSTLIVVFGSGEYESKLSYIKADIYAVDGTWRLLWWPSIYSMLGLLVYAAGDLIGNMLFNAFDVLKRLAMKYLFSFKMLSYEEHQERVVQFRKEIENRDLEIDRQSKAIARLNVQLEEQERPVSELEAALHGVDKHIKQLGKPHIEKNMAGRKDQGNQNSVVASNVMVKPSNSPEVSVNAEPKINRQIEENPAQHSQSISPASIIEKYITTPADGQLVIRFLILKDDYVHYSDVLSYLKTQYGHLSDGALALINTLKGGLVESNGSMYRIVPEAREVLQRFTEIDSGKYKQRPPK